jgi:hypothetical protein
MTPGENQENTIQLLTETEEAIGRLYEAYSNTMPEHEEFWFGLVMEEADHSNLVHSLLNKVRKGTASFVVDPKVAGEVKGFLGFLKQEQERAKRENMAFTDALNIALNIEKSIVKKNFYRLFKNPSQDVSSVLHQIRRDAENHVKFLQRELTEQENRG